MKIAHFNYFNDSQTDWNSVLNDSWKLIMSRVGTKFSSKKIFFKVNPTFVLTQIWPFTNEIRSFYFFHFWNNDLVFQWPRIDLRLTPNKINFGNNWQKDQNRTNMNKLLVSILITQFYAIRIWKYFKCTCLS